MQPKRMILWFTFLVFTIIGQSLAQPPNTLWVRTYAGQVSGLDQALDCAVDNSGNLYIVGQSGNWPSIDFFIIKCNTNTGDTIWTRTYNGAANNTDLALGCAVDSAGNLYVTGFSSNGTNTDFLTIKYNASTGDTIWTRRYNGTANGDDGGAECLLDGSGNLYVTGFSSNGSNADYFTIKYNASTGDTVWTRRYDGIGAGRDEAYACALDNSGNLFVNGYSYNGTSYNLLSLKYDTNGNITWTGRSNDTIDSLMYVHSDCVVDGAGNLYVTGMCGIQAGNIYSVTIKYNSSGDTVWTTRYDGPNVYDATYGCALDALGNLYATGASYNGSNDDILTIKYTTTNGNIQWTTTYNGTANLSDYGVSCVTDQFGYLYVVGSVNGFDNGDCVAIKYNTGTTGVLDQGEGPTSFRLQQNYPNPFNPSTVITFELPRDSYVTLKVYNILGQEITTLVDGYYPIGRHHTQFDASGLPSGLSSKGGYASGVYFYRINAGESISGGGFIDTKQMILIK